MITWRPVRGGMRAVLATTPLIIAVTHESIKRLEPGEPRWNVIVFGRRLADRQHTYEDAMRIAEEEARRQLEQALERLNGGSRIAHYRGT